MHILNYVKYHPESKMLPQQYDAFVAAHDEHHKMQPHHIEHYNGNVFEISPVILVEMVCDWHSANFEQNNITNELEFESVINFFEARLSHMPWASSQVKVIYDAIDVIQTHQDVNTIRSIWDAIQG